MKDRLSHIPPNDNEVIQIDIQDRLNRLGGVERAPRDLIEKMSRLRGDSGVPRRLMFEQFPGDDGERFLNSIPAEASSGGPGRKEITYRTDITKAAILEEYLHGVQDDIGIPHRLGVNYSEWHVRDFMIRNQKLLTLIPEDVARLDADRQKYAALPDVQEKIESETARKLEARRSPLASAAEHHASRAVGAVSLGVDLAQGNYGAAAVDAAAMAAENKAVQEAAVETATKVGGSGLVKAFAACAKRAPVIGAAVTLAFVAKEAGAHMLDGEYKLAGAATVAGLAEAGGNVLGFGMGDAAREAARGAMIAAGGDEFAAVEKSGIRELGEAAYDVGKQMLTAPSPAQKPPEGRVLTDILPPDMRSMMQGADEMGDRSEIRHVAIERTGLAANDPRNDLGTLNQNPNGPKAHLLILADGRVQGPDEGGVPFDRNPSIAAGKNGETIGVMYAGQGAMNDAQWSTVRQISDYVAQQRRLEGRGGTPELMAGSTATADMLGLPTPRGSQLAQTTQTPAFHQRQTQAFGT